MALVNNQAALNTVYNHFLTTYAPTTNNSSRYDTHKKSELRNIYNSIVKLNKESPLYIVDTSQETQEFAVGMKENARQLSNTIQSLSSQDSGDVLSQKAASSTNEDIVSAKFIGDPNGTDDNLSFDISVEKLATSQINLGHYLDSDSPVGLESGTYSFDVHINDTDYEFQFNIGDSDTNRSIQDKLASLINRSNIGLEASVSEDDDGNSALRLESTATGEASNQRALFEVSDDKTSKASGAVDYFGVSDIARQSGNAIFTLNGTQRTAFSNTFTVDKRFELNLRGINEADDSVTIGIKPDIESMSDNVHQLVDSYNAFIDKVAAYSGTKVRTETFLSDIQRTNLAYSGGLESMGLHFTENGNLEVNEDELRKTLETEDSNEHFSTLKSFTSALMRKSGQISLNPMNYVQKTVVAYKNPGRSFANPYITSIYSGMMFNGYC